MIVDIMTNEGDLNRREKRGGIQLSKMKRVRIDRYVANNTRVATIIFGINLVIT